VGYWISGVLGWELDRLIQTPLSFFAPEVAWSKADGAIEVAVQ
jgi:hypothetical protein